MLTVRVIRMLVSNGLSDKIDENMKLSVDRKDMCLSFVKKIL